MLFVIEQSGNFVWALAAPGSPAGGAREFYGAETIHLDVRSHIRAAEVAVILSR